MINNIPLLKKISISISDAIDRSFSISGVETVSGGCINSTYEINDGQNSFFIKINSSSSLHMFEAEHLALLDLEASNSLRVPHPVCTGKEAEHSWLVMEYLSLQNSGHHNELGKQLAAMHQYTNREFGWVRNNTIGSTAQINTPSNNWILFFREFRLRFQLDLAASNGYTGSLQKTGAALLDCIDDFFVGYTPQPSLLHGDLWGGNYAFDDNRLPVIFDPALYFGDRETDIAMTELFGGFSHEFRISYEEHWPLHDDYSTRKNLYNCYHILNHLNLFGGGYAHQAENMMQRLLSERN